MKLMSIVVACLAPFSSPSTVQEPSRAELPLRAALEMLGLLQEKSSLAAERRDLAEIRLLLGADRKYSEAKERLAKLKESLAQSTGADAKDLLAEVARLLADVRRALGEAVTEDGLDKLVVDAWSASFAQDKVDEAVLAALARNDASFLSELGARAGPGLAQAVRLEPDVLPGNGPQDALYLLLELDPRSGDELLREMLEHDGFFWKKRAVRALGEASPWDGQALFSTESPRRWLGPGIQQTLEKYAGDPDVGNPALAHLGALSNAGADSEVLVRLLADALRSTDTLRREAAKNVLRNHRFEPIRPILEAALDDGDTDLRVFAALTMVRHADRHGPEECRALLARADDPEPEVRKLVAGLLEKSDAKRWQREEPVVLAKLLQDREASVREPAWKILGSLPAEKRTTILPAEQGFTEKPLEFRRSEYVVLLPLEAYRSLLERTDSPERAKLASIAADLPAPTCFELTTALARDSSPSVVVAVQRYMERLPHWSDPAALLRIASALLDNPVRPPTHGNPIEEVLKLLAYTRAGLTALARWIIERDETSLVDQVNGRQLATIDPRLFADFVTWRFESGVMVSNDLWLHWKGPAMRLLAEDRSRPLVLRMLALQAVLSDRKWDEGLGPTVEEVLADPGWGALEEAQWKGLVDPLHDLVEDLPGDARNRAITVLLDNPAVPEGLSEEAISTFDRNTDGGARIGKRVLERWFRPDTSHRAVREVIGAMAFVPELRDDRVLAEAARGKPYRFAAWNAIAALKEPVFLPLIREALEESGEHKAAEALFGYLSDEAAELLLLAAARVQDNELRDRCLAHLEKIREYQDSRERWATRKVKTATREQVLAQLLEQLSAKSDDVKVQAIRALATWEAVEAMPKLIELTTTGSKPVAAAAREALERLNAQKKD